MNATTNGMQRITEPTEVATSKYRSMAAGFACPVSPIAADRPPFTPDIVPWMMTDPSVRIGLRMLVGPIASSEWTVQANHPEVEKFVDATIHDIWDSAVSVACGTTEAFGHFGAEVVYEERQGRLWFSNLLDFGLWDSRPLIADGKICGVQVDRGYGIPGSLQLWGMKGFWFHAGGANRNVYGESSLSSAFDPWLDLYMPFGLFASQRLWYTRNPFSSGIMKYPEGITELFDDDGNPTGIQRPNVSLAREMSANMLAGAVINIPSERDEKGSPYWEWVPPAANSAPTDMMDVIQEKKRDIWRGMGIQDEIVVASQTGSGFSGRQIPLEAFLKDRERMRNRFWRAMESQVVRPLVRKNFGLAADFKVEFKKLYEQQQGDQQQPGQPKPPGVPGQPTQPPAGQPVTMAAEFDESKHPRAADGKFGEGGSRESTPVELDKYAPPEITNPHADKYNPANAPKKVGSKWSYVRIDGKVAKETFGTRREAETEAYRHKASNASSSLSSPKTPEPSIGYKPESSVVQSGGKWWVIDMRGKSFPSPLKTREEAVAKATEHMNFMRETRPDEFQKIMAEPSRPAKMSVTLMQTAHAPSGGASVAGKHFDGGEFIPGDVVAEATDAEKTKIGVGPKVSAAKTGDQQILKDAWSRREVPDGWFVHGRGGRQDLETGNVIQTTTNPSIAEQYAGRRGGSVWMLKPSDDAKVLDLTDEATVASTVAKLRKARDDGSLSPALDDIVDNASDEELASSIAPRDIVNSAELFDDRDFVSWLWESEGVQFVRTPDARGGPTGVFLDASAAVKHRVDDPATEMSVVTMAIDPRIAKATRFTDRVVSEAAKAGSALSQQAKRRLL